MTEPPPVHRHAPGISRESAFRPDAVFRTLLVVVAAVFAGLTVAALAGDPLDRPVSALVALAMLAASTYAAVRAWTTRVWIEVRYPTGWVPGASPDPGREATISELLAGAPPSHTYFVVESAGLTGIRRRQAVLEHPATVEVSGAALTGARPSWCVTVRAPGGAGRPAATVTVRAPWLTDLGALLVRLRDVVSRDERLAADADTLALVSGRRPLRERRWPGVMR